MIDTQAKKVKSVAMKSSALSAKNLKMISNPKKYQTPKDDLDFQVPTPIAPTVYRNQGMRDQEAIQNLKVLESKTTSLVQSRVLELVELVPFFAQPTVSCYIEKNKDKLINIKDLLLKAQENTE